MNRYRTEIKWAFLFLAMLLLWMAMEKFTGLHDRYLEQQQYVTMLILVPSIAIYLLAIREKKRNYYSGSMKYGQSFKTGLMLTLFIVLLSPVSQLVSSYVISPDYFSKFTNYTVQSGIYTQEQAAAQFNIRNYIITSMIGAGVTGFIFSAVISIFVRTKNI